MTEVARQAYGADSSPASGMKELFVINLCASMTPMPDVPRQLNGYEKYRLYQIAKMEDGRRRYRLRMGFFTSETDAEFLVASIRSMYPAALVSCAVSEDLRFAETDQPSRPQADTTATKPASATVRPVTNISPTPVSAPATATPAAPAAAAPAAATKSMPAAPAEASLTLVDPPSPTALSSTPSPETTAETRIFHVGRGVDIPESSLELTAEEPALPTKHAAAQTPASKAATAASDKAAPAAKPAPAVVASKPAAPVKTPAVSSAPKPVAAAATNKPAPTTSKPVNVPSTSQAAAQPIMAATIQTPAAKDDYVPILDTTLTIRTLTKAEADDPNRPKWFVVQLASSDRPIDISTMPKLDIFAAYSLYCVALMEQGGIRHTLRLGFFKEQVSADAVMGYLKTFFNSPCVTQISSAEYDRFTADKPKKPAQAAAPVAPTQPARAATPTAIKPAAVNPAAKPAAAKVVVPPSRSTDAGKSQSFLSRLIGKQLD